MTDVRDRSLDEARLATTGAWPRETRSPAARLGSSASAALTSTACRGRPQDAGPCSMIGTSGGGSPHLVAGLNRPLEPYRQGPNRAVSGRNQPIARFPDEARFCPFAGEIWLWPLGAVSPSERKVPRSWQSNSTVLCNAGDGATLWLAAQLPERGLRVPIRRPKWATDGPRIPWRALETACNRCPTLGRPHERKWPVCRRFPVFSIPPPKADDGSRTRDLRLGKPSVNAVLTADSARMGHQWATNLSLKSA